MYMSYCRFEGTRRELAACLNEVEDHVNEEAEYEVSDHEIAHFKKMMVELVDWLNDMCLLDDEGYLDREELDKVCQAMAKSYKEEEE